ncbi:MAG: hypothetical protein ACXVZ1_09440 [Gaiellaceae bacterium]
MNGYVDPVALGKVLVTSFAFATLVVVAFSQALLGADRALAHSGVLRERAAGWLLVTLGLGICAGAGIVAVYVMTSK